MDALTQSAESGEGNLLELAVDAARNRCTVGEISYALEKVWGRHVAEVKAVSGVYAGEMGDDTELVSKVREKANNFAKADLILTDIITADPDYTEAWNKRATIRFLAGDFVGSEADIYETLQREPRPFGAISGLGLI